MEASTARKLHYCDLSVTACHALFAWFSVPGFNLKHESPPVAAGGLVLVAGTLERPRTDLFLSDHAPAFPSPGQPPGLVLFPAASRRQGFRSSQR